MLRVDPAPVSDESLTPSLKPIQAKDFGYDQARHLLWRAGFGGTSEQIKLLADWGPSKSVDYILNFDKVAYDKPKPDAFDKDIMRPPTPEERRAIQEARKNRDEDTLAQLQAERQRRERLDRDQVREMRKAWLKRMIETPRPLEEKLTLFWHGHFATSYRTIENSYHMYMQNCLFREHATGSFRDLLRGIIRDPAMLAYLNNNQSRKEHPNENLAREIMELFSLGIGNYTEKDIKEGARALTGYSFEDDEFTYNRRNHDEGTKSILGAAGNLDGDAFVDAILAKPQCAAYIARRVYHFLVADVPTEERGGAKALPREQQEALGGLAGTLRSSNYQLRPMLRRLFLSEHFYQPRFMNDQVKSPVVLLVGAVRSLGTPVRDLSILADSLDLMGQNILFPPSVKGWEGGRAWINTSTLFVRQNLTAFLLTGKKPKGYDASAKTDPYDPAPLLADLAPAQRQDASAIADHFLRLCLGRIPVAAQTEVRQFFAANANKINTETLTGALLLITALPEYQLC